MTPEDLVRKKIRESDLQVDARVDQSILADALDRLKIVTDQQAVVERSNRWRLIMNNPKLKLVTAAVIVIAVFVGIRFLGGSIESTSWAEIYNNVQRSSTVSFNLYLSEVDGKSKLLGHVYEKDGHLVRREFPNKELPFQCDTMVMDKETGRVSLMDTERKLVWRDAIENVPAFTSMYDLFKDFRNHPGNSVEELGSSEVSGQTLLGFKLSNSKGEYHGSYEHILWANPESMLPVRVELETTLRTLKKSKAFMADFRFDEPLDDALFVFEPKGYQIGELSTLEQQVRTKSAKIGNRMRSALKMNTILKACRKYTQDHQGQWPDTLDALEPYGIDPEARVNSQRIDMAGYVYIKPSLPVSDSTIVLHEAYDQWSEGINIGCGNFQVQFIRDEVKFKGILNK